MKDEAKTKKQLIEELAEMRQRVVELEESKTDSRHADEKVRWDSRLEPLVLILNNSIMGICLVRNRIVEWANPRLPEMLGLTMDKLLGASSRIIYPSDKAYEEMGCKAYAALSRGESFDFEVVMPRADGTTFMGRAIGKALDPSHPQEGSVWMFEDITERKRAEEALRDSEEKYRLVVENAREAIAIIQDGMMKFVNPRVVDMLGFSVEELKSKSFIEFVHPEDQELVFEHHMKRMNNEEIPSAYRFRAITKDGMVKWAEIHATVVSWHGRPAALGFFIDVTDRKLAAEALRKTTERHRTILSQLYVGTLVVSEDNRIEYANQTFCDLFGLRDLPSELIGLTAEEMIEKMRPAYAYPTETLDRIRETVAQGRRVVGEEVLMSDGRMLLVDFVPIVVDGKQSGRMWQHRDITERRRTEEALRESEVKFRALAESLSSAMFLIQGTKYIYTNPAFEVITGYTIDDLADMNFWDVVHIDFQELVRERNFARQRGESMPSRYEIKITTKNNEEKWIDLAATFIEFGNKPTVMGSAFDITKRKRAEEALRKAEGEKVAILDAMSELVIYLDTDMKVIWSNNAMNSQFNMTSSQMEGRHCFEALHKLNRPCNICPAVEAIETGRPCTIDDFSSLGKRWTLRAYPVRNEAGNLVGVVEIVTDITERKRAEDALRTTNKQLQDIIEFLPDATVIADKDNKIIAWNRAMEEMTGLSKASIMGQHHHQATIPFYGEVRPSLMDLVCVDDRELAAKYSGVRRIGAVIHAEAFTPTLYNNRGAYVFAAASPLLDEAGDVVGIIESIRDITERRRAEDELRKALLDLQELNFIVSKSPAIAFLWSTVENWPVEFVSENIVQFGYVPNDFTSGRISYAKIIHPNDLNRIVDEVKCYIQEGRTEYTQEYRIITKSGDVRWIDDHTWIRKDANGRITHHQGIVVDITERRRLEERLHRAEKMEALGTLAGGVAHDLNNVLGIVVGYSELLLLDKTDESSAVKSHAMNIMKGGQRAAAIVQDLLTLARRGVNVEKIVNLNTAINDFQKSPEFEKLCSFHPDVRIRTELNPDLLNIKGSPVHLAKTFFNLVSNAAEAMPNGGVVTVSTKNEYLDRPIQGYDDVREGDYVVLSVSDTGEGISAADLKRIFEPFYTKKVMGRSGTGLGLAVVWGTVKDHNGYINVQSQEGKETTFTLYFPVTREEVTKDQVSIPVSEYMGNAESILVVDDVEGQRELASQMLKKLNYNAVAVSSGEEAVEYLKNKKVDLVILDMIMEPGIDGLDTYRKILEINPKQKAIIVSGFSETVRVKQAQALGAGAYIRKPYVLEKLGLIVRKELD